MEIRVPKFLITFISASNVNRPDYQILHSSCQCNEIHPNFFWMWTIGLKFSFLFLILISRRRSIRRLHHQLHSFSGIRLCPVPVVFCTLLPTLKIYTDWMVEKLDSHPLFERIPNEELPRSCRQVSLEKLKKESKWLVITVINISPYATSVWIK